MRYLFLLFFFFLGKIIWSQECEPTTLKDKRYYQKAQKMISNGNYTEVIQLFNEHKSEQKIAAFYALQSIAYWHLDNPILAEEYAEKSVAICKNPNGIIYFILGAVRYSNGLYEESEQYLQKALEIGLEEKWKKQAIELNDKAHILSDLITNPVAFNPKVVHGVSTNADEYLPILSPDQELFLYTRRGEKKEVGSLTNSIEEEFVFSKGNKNGFDGGWKMPPPFNTNTNEGGACITIDNQTLYFTACEGGYAYNNCDLFYVFRDGENWSDVVSFGRDINKPDSWESQPSVSADGKTIIFASDRRGGNGGADLYSIAKDVNGNWGKPQNLGENINTKDNEKSPFLHTDNQTLFFASNQFPSVGGYDIFFSRKDSLGNWQKPKNIGYPINTSADELGLFVSTDGQKAYFASNQLNGIGGWDVYSFDLYAEAKPQSVLFLKGKLEDENGDVVEDATIEIKNIITNEKQTVQTDKEGIYTLAYTMKNSKEVLLSAHKDGYAFQATYIHQDSSTFHTPTQLDIAISKLEEGKAFEIENIYFEYNSFELNRVAKQILDAFAEYLIKHISLRIAIYGHTDNIGSEEDNLLLSENRAKAVYLFLAEQGVDISRVSYKGFGEQQPIAPNNSAEGRSANRRTEFIILSH